MRANARRPCQKLIFFLFRNAAMPALASGDVRLIALPALALEELLSCRRLRQPFRPAVHSRCEARSEEVGRELRQRLGRDLRQAPGRDCRVRNLRVLVALLEALDPAHGRSMTGANAPSDARGGEMLGCKFRVLVVRAGPGEYGIHRLHDLDALVQGHQRALE